MSTRAPSGESSQPMKDQGDRLLKGRVSGVPGMFSVLEEVLAQAPVAFALWAPDGTVVATNTAFSEVFGSAPPPSYSVLQDDVAREQGLQELVARAFRGERIEIPGFWWNRRDVPPLSEAMPQARRVFFSVRFVPVHGEDGSVSFVAALYEDLTALQVSLQRLQESETELRAILDNSSAVVFLKDLDGRYLFINRRYEELFHVSRNDIIGKTDFDVFAPEFARAFREADRRALEADRTVEIEETVPQDDGLHHYISLKFPLRRSDGKPYGICGIATDVTERKRAADDLRAEGKRKNDFLAALSHELRNPLAPIRNGLDILAHTTVGGEQARRALAIIDRQVTHLTCLVDQLLDVTRIARGKIELKRERLDLAELARRTVEDHSEMFVACGLDCRASVTSDSVWVDGDRTRLEQAIGNLLQNAAKFTPRGGKVAVSVEVNAASAQAILTVCDSGAGIEPEIMPRLFETFTQADRTLDRSQGGLGLGLAVVKGLIEMHGGSVSAASQGVGKGAEFTIRLPLAAAPTASRKPQLDLPRVRSPRRVLVIEDNVDAADSLRLMLELRGHIVGVAHDGPTGLERGKALCPEVVLCDVGLPGMDGYDVARAMRADEALGHATLVALSGYARPEDVARAKEAGFNAHIAKPATWTAIEKILATTLWADGPDGGPHSRNRLIA